MDPKAVLPMIEQLSRDVNTLKTNASSGDHPFDSDKVLQWICKCELDLYKIKCVLRNGAVCSEERLNDLRLLRDTVLLNLCKDEEDDIDQRIQMLTEERKSAERRLHRLMSQQSESSFSSLGSLFSSVEEYPNSDHPDSQESQDTMLATIDVRRRSSMAAVEMAVHATAIDSYFDEEDIKEEEEEEEEEDM